MAGNAINLVIENKENIRIFVKTVRAMIKHDQYISFIFRNRKLILLCHRDYVAISTRFEANFFDTYEINKPLSTAAQHTVVFQIMKLYSEKVDHLEIQILDELAGYMNICMVYSCSTIASAACPIGEDFLHEDAKRGGDVDIPLEIRPTIIDSGENWYTN